MFQRSQIGSLKSGSSPCSNTHSIASWLPRFLVAIAARLQEFSVNPMSINCSTISAFGVCSMRAAEAAAARCAAEFDLCICGGGAALGGAAGGAAGGATARCASGAAAPPPAPGLTARADDGGGGNLPDFFRSRSSLRYAFSSSSKSSRRRSRKRCLAVQTKQRTDSG